MKYVAAYALMALSGKQNISEADLKKFMTASGCEVNDESLTSVCSSLKGKELHQVINDGFKQISSLGGGATTSGSNAGPAKVEVKAVVEEEVVEEEEEDMDLGDLF